MDVFQLKNSGWMRVLHWFAKRGGWKYKRYGQHTDFCHWVRRMLWGLTWVLVCTAALLAFWGFTAWGSHNDLVKWAQETGYTWPMWTLWVWAVLALPGFIIGVIMALLGVVGVGAGVHWLIHAYKAYRRKVGLLHIEKEPSQLRKGWTAFRNKYCIKIRVPYDMQ